MHSISNELFFKVIGMYPLFEVVLPNLVYFKDKSISSDPLIFTSNAQFVTVQTYDQNRENISILLNLYVHENDGIMIIKQRDEPLVPLTDITCCDIFDCNITITNRFRDACFWQYDPVEIRRRFVISNIINDD